MTSLWNLSTKELLRLAEHHAIVKTPDKEAAAFIEELVTRVRNALVAIREAEYSAKEH